MSSLKLRKILLFLSNTNLIRDVSIVAVVVDAAAAAAACQLNT